ncbi:MAG TPA: hypothetical protein VG817_00550 [Gemmatimonadales bacterium]|nr:hypothetical protein [Gemmatimonadales bacterium]
MSLKSALGLDWFDLTVHVVLTITAMVVVDSIAPRGSTEDAFMAATLAGSVLVLAWRRARNRGRLPAAPEYDDDRLGQLEDRVMELEAAQQRIMELEERVDFTERLLARERDLKLGAGRED